MNKQLPERPDLEQLKNQAKGLLDEVHAGRPDALARIGKENPAAFALHDAQRTLAREYGFESWLKLKWHVETRRADMTGPLIPLLMVYDMRRALKFYRDALGFEIEQTWEPDGHLYWARLKCGRTRLMLNAEFEDDQRRPEHDRPHGKDVIFYFYPANVTALREILVAKGVPAGPVRVQHYGHKQFEVKDPDGYTICFSQETSDPPTESIE